MRGHSSVFPVPAVHVESILQRECERTVRDVGVGPARWELKGTYYTLVTVPLWLDDQFVIVSTIILYLRIKDVQD